MGLNFRFAVVSDLHIALPHTIWDHPSRFHFVEVSIPALEMALERLSQLELDFLLLPGDLTQHGEPENHQWLAQRLAQLPFPTYVIPGNHDVPVLLPNQQSIGLADFPSYYRHCGYSNPKQLYYTCEVVPGVRLIALNSNCFDETGQQLGRLDDMQLTWLKEVLASPCSEGLTMVMIHHNVVEHLPGQSQHGMGRRYMLENAPDLLGLLRAAGVQLIFSGHLHIQDVACCGDIYDITTGSLVSYPHPYRLLEFRTDDWGRQWLQIESQRVESVAGWPDLAQMTREYMGDRSFPFMLRLLSEPPLNLPRAEAEALAPSLRYFWADISQGDPIFDFAHLPPQIQTYFAGFTAVGSDRALHFIDNFVTLLLKST